MEMLSPKTNEMLNKCSNIQEVIKEKSEEIVLIVDGKPIKFKKVAERSAFFSNSLP